jgi:hypothetical protein
VAEESTAAGGPYQTSPSQSSQNPLARSVVRTVISGANDALNLLFDVRSSRGPARLAADADVGPTHFSHVSTRQENIDNLQEPAETDPPMDMPSQHTPKAQGSVARVWQSCHFVRMGWLTAREAIQYVDL